MQFSLLLTVEVSVVDFPRDGGSRNSLCDALQHNASIGCHFLVTWQLRKPRRHCTTLAHNYNNNDITIILLPAYLCFARAVQLYVDYRNFC